MATGLIRRLLPDRRGPRTGPHGTLVKTPAEKHQAKGRGNWACWDATELDQLTAAAAVRRALAGDWSAGFQTPARVFGADFILGLGCAVLEAAPETQTGVPA